MILQLAVISRSKFDRLAPSDDFRERLISDLISDRISPLNRAAITAKSHSPLLLTVKTGAIQSDIFKKKGRSLGSERPLNSAGWLTMSSALCGDGDNNNVTNYDTDQSLDGETDIMVFAHVRNDFAVAIFQLCGDRDRGHADAT